jgi:hypothetical protein
LKNNIPFLSLIITLLILSYPTIVLSQNTIPKEINTIEKVGAIFYDSALDNPNYYLCDEMNIMEYYQVNPKFKEGHNSVRHYFKEEIKTLRFSAETTGLLTIRFVINCRGEIGRVRSFGIDSNYKSIMLNQKKVNLISDHIKQMPNWTQEEYDGKKYDSYKMISFKIKNGIITEILP